ncbi:hypothetical protein GCM10023168_13950 [Fodinibacter luteus]|uniref:Uncharacterized protein n=1 Tax=Fodinibacter luteus TaxID=552064 RepID=A0ABP8KBI8_9MICO
MIRRRRHAARLVDLERRVTALERDRLADRLDRLRAALDELGMPLDVTPTKGTPCHDRTDDGRNPR